MKIIQEIEKGRLNSKEMEECRGGKKTYTPKEGTYFHTETDCYQEWYVHHSFLGIKWTSKKTEVYACSHMPQGGNRCSECCENCPLVSKSQLG